MQEPYRYWAFISYSHADRAWGDWLHRALEIYRVPRRLVGRASRDGVVPRRLYPIFRDRDELPSSADLGRVIGQALRESRYLIVICSPQSAASRWVNEEVRHFKSLGRADRVLTIIVGGQPHASELPASGVPECFPPAVRFEISPSGELTGTRAHPIAADARGGKDGRANARLKLIAGLLGVGLDELKQRERQRQLWRRLGGAAAAAMLLLAGTEAWRWQSAARQRALQAQELKTRIAQLYQNGRREFLAHNEARAAVFLNEAYALGVDTPALRYLLGRAMRVVDAQALRIQTGSPVLTTYLSRDGQRLFSLGDDLHLRVWDAVSGKETGDSDLGDVTGFNGGFGGQGHFIWAETDHATPPRRRLNLFDATTAEPLLQYEADPESFDTVMNPVDDSERHLSFVRPDKSIAIVNLETRTELDVPGRYTMTRFCDGGRLLIAGSADGVVSLLGAASGKVVRHFQGLRGAVIAADSSVGCTTLVAGTNEGSVRVWDTGSGELLMTAGESRAITDLGLNPEGSRLMSQTRKGVSIWDVGKSALLFAVASEDPNNSAATVSPDGRWLASMSRGHLGLFDPVGGRERYSLDGHQGQALGFSFSADSRRLASGGSDGSLVIWNLPRDALADLSLGASPDRGPGSEAFPPFAPVAFNHRGDQFFAGGADGVGELWDSHSLQQQFRLEGDAAPLNAVAFSPDDKILATGNWDRSVRLWDTASGKLLRVIDRPGGRIWRLSFDPAGRLLGGGVQGGLSKLWDVASGSELAVFERDQTWAQAFSPRSAAYAFGIHGVVRLWNTERGEFVWSTPLPADETSGPDVAVLAFSPDGGQILATLLRRKAFVLDAATGRIVREMSDSSSADFLVGAFSPDGRQVALGDGGRAVLSWEPATGRTLTLAGHTGQVTSALFSPDSALLLSAGQDGVVNIWDAGSGELLETFAAGSGAVGLGNALFSPDGTRILVGGTDNVAHLWALRSESRSPHELASLLGCRVGWRVEGVTLVSTSPSSRSCEPVQAASPARSPSPAPSPDS